MNTPDYKDGGPAFPTPNQGDSRTHEDGTVYWQYPGLPGMSLRDWLAGQALAGLLSNPSNPAIEPNDRTRVFSELSYVIADAMLEARKETSK